ncbi:alkaline phosphatase family protein [Candidatus Roizmanbacteria bacterium]|nr:alkaline phosphatase family protein [Candidatus Roizmanbacteria bacterium]
MNKILIIQIDSLSLDALHKAISKGYMPFFKELVDQGWSLEEMFCGLPSTTPASQVCLFYGISLLPGFRFVLKKEKKIFTPQYIETFDLVENSTFLKNKNGLLKRGMGVSSLFSGGSSKSVSVDMMKKNKKIFISHLLYFLNPFTFILRLLKLIVLMIIERSEHRLDKDNPLPYAGFTYLLYRAFHEIFIGELGYYTIKKAIGNEDKILYVNFTGYDEMSHHYGGYSDFTMFYLSVLDFYIKGCSEEIKKNNDERELIIISDHGFAPSIPITEFLGSTIGEKIISLYPGKKIIEHKLKYQSDYLSKSDLYLLNSGGFCLGYYIKKESQVKRKELENDFPDFCKKISEIPAVELVLIKENKLVVIKEGRTLDFSVENSSLLFPLIDKKYHKKMHDDLVLLMNGPYAPDVCIVAKILEKNKVIDFEPQLSSHGGIGGFQTQSFLLSRRPFFPTKSLPHIKDLHHYLEKEIYR